MQPDPLEGPSLQPVPPPTPWFAPLLRTGYLLVLLYGFLVAIQLMSGGISALVSTGALGGGGDGQELFRGISNPFAGLALGILFTVMVQSSSTTTSAIVAVVGSGNLSVEAAVPMILGANVGTTITNTLVAIGHVRQSREFERAFAAATVHDFFNMLAVAVMLPLELTTRFLSRAAERLSGELQLGGGATYKSPIKIAIKTTVKWLQARLDDLGFEGTPLGIALLVLGIGLTFLCLHQITKNMRQLLAGRIERAMNRVLEATAVFGILIGIGITVAVQSSSITTSLLVPMCAAGVMRLENAFPIMLGANIGTTVTGVLASVSADSPAALTIALVHVLFNLTGVILFFPIAPIRRLPIALSRALAAAATRNRLWLVVHVLGVFVAAPLVGWFLWRGSEG